VAHHLPTGKQGRIRWTYEGEEGNDEAERLIQELHAEKEVQSEDKSNSAKSAKAR